MVEQAGGVRIGAEGAVGICRIDSPATRNALGPELMRALIEGLETLDADPAVRCLILAGSDEVFATGADARSLSGDAYSGGSDPAEFWSRFTAIHKPIVAGVSGWALGTGFELALASDLVVASKVTRFGQPEVTLGLIPGGGATQRLTRAIGKHRTMEMILTGQRIGAELAHSYGLVNVLADRRRWLAQTTDLAAQIAERAPLAVQIAKRAILAADRELLADGLETERRLQTEAMATEDRIEGVAAFLEGRQPKFEGR